MNRGLLVLVLAAVAVLAAPSIAAAASPTLTATVMPGREIDLLGSGFPADADIVLAIKRNGLDIETRAINSDAKGTFTAVIDAGPGRGGLYDVTATSGTVSASVEAVAVETAGGLQSTPPATDTISITGSPAPVDARPIAALGVLVGLAVLAAMHRRRGLAGLR